MRIEEAVQKVKRFEGDRLTDKLSSLEREFSGLYKRGIEESCQKHSIDSKLLVSAFEIKKLTSQINISIHAIGMLAALPHLINDDEYIEYLSLGAGNTGHKFDLETDKRIAEFKFISWQGGAEAIRQNSLFKDFYELAEHETHKERYLYVLGIAIPLKFFNGHRAIQSVLSKSTKLSREFIERHGNRFVRVNEYYQYRKNLVKIVDLNSLDSASSAE